MLDENHFDIYSFYETKALSAMVIMGKKVLSPTSR